MLSISNLGLFTMLYNILFAFGFSILDIKEGTFIIGFFWEFVNPFRFKIDGIK